MFRSAGNPLRVDLEAPVSIPSEALILAPIILLAFSNEAMTGFGAIMVAVTLGALFISVERVVPILIPLSIILTGYVVIRHRKDVLFGLLLKQILPAMGLGLALGTLIFPWLKGAALKPILGLLIITFAVRQLYLYFRGHEKETPLPRLVVAGFQMAAGVVQAIFASGGPLLVYSISRLNLPKRTFRATMCSVWLTLNCALFVIFVANGRMNASILQTVAWLIPVLPVGIIIGEWLHGLVDEERFKLVVYLILLISGLVLTIKSLIL